MLRFADDCGGAVSERYDPATGLNYNHFGVYNIALIFSSHYNLLLSLSYDSIARLSLVLTTLGSDQPDKIHNNAREK